MLSEGIEHTPSRTALPCVPLPSRGDFRIPVMEMRCSGLSCGYLPWLYFKVPSQGGSSAGGFDGGSPINVCSREEWLSEARLCGYIGETGCIARWRFGTAPEDKRIKPWLPSSSVEIAPLLCSSQ